MSSQDKAAGKEDGYRGRELWSEEKKKGKLCLSETLVKQLIDPILQL